MIPTDPFALLCLYRDRGWALVPVRAGEKRPSIQDWPNRKFDVLDCDPADNVGIKLGHRSGGLVDVDLDCGEALALADIYLPDTSAVFGRASKPRSHRLYVATDAVFAAFVDPIAGDTLLEIRADGQTGGCHQTIVPPSVAGERREWCGDIIEPAPVDCRALERHCIMLAIGCLVHRYVGETPALSPWAPGWDHLRLLWECDQEIGRLAYGWLKRPAPDEAHRYPRPRAERSPIEVELDELAAAIPNDVDWHGWNNVGMAFYVASGGSDAGFVAFDDFSAKSPKYDARETAARWVHFGHSPPSRIGKGSLIWWARRAGWRPGGPDGCAA
jgi:hypothetical protein